MRSGETPLFRSEAASEAPALCRQKFHQQRPPIVRTKTRERPNLRACSCNDNFDFFRKGSPVHCFVRDVEEREVKKEIDFGGREVAMTIWCGINKAAANLEFAGPCVELTDARQECAEKDGGKRKCAVKSAQKRLAYKDALSNAKTSSNEITALAALKPGLRYQNHGVHRGFKFVEKACSIPLMRYASLRRLIGDAEGDGSDRFSPLPSNGARPATSWKLFGPPVASSESSRCAFVRTSESHFQKPHRTICE